MGERGCKTQMVLTGLKASRGQFFGLKMFFGDFFGRLVDVVGPLGFVIGF